MLFAIPARPIVEEALAFLQLQLDVLQFGLQFFYARFFTVEAGFGIQIFFLGRLFVGKEGLLVLFFHRRLAPGTAEKPTQRDYEGNSSKIFKHIVSKKIWQRLFLSSKIYIFNKNKNLWRVMP